MIGLTGSLLLGLKEIKESCIMAWKEHNSIPKWSFCYALMVLTILAVSDAFLVI